MVVSDFEFPTIGQIWQAQTQRGARVVTVPAGNSIPLERFADAIDDETLLVAITHVCYRNGVMLDVPGHLAGPTARARWCCSMPPNLGDDANRCQRHSRWIFSQAAPYKVFAGLVRAGLPLCAQGTVAHPPADGHRLVCPGQHFSSIARPIRRPPRRQFEAGSPPVPNLYATLAGIKLVQWIGLERIQREVRDITSAIKEGAMRRGWNLVSPVDPHKHGALITLRSHKV